jgi:hypothetical protein
VGDLVFVLLAMKLNFGISFAIDGKDFIFLIAFHELVHYFLIVKIEIQRFF